MAEYIPVDSENSAYIMRVELDGEFYHLRYRYMERARSWFMDLYDANEEPLVLGKRVVLDWPMIRQFKYLTTVPQGQIMGWDTTGRKIPPGVDDFGDRVKIIYFVEGDLGASV